MATIPEAFSVALSRHQAGELVAAEQIYRQILAVDPNHADALHLLGLIAHQTGRHDLAVEYIRRAIQLNGAESGFHNNLGAVHKAQGKLAEAVACFRRALELEPGDVDARNNLGNALKAQGKLPEAVACFQQVLEVKPDFPEVHNNLGLALQAEEKLDEAVASYRRALELKPDFAVAHNNLGNAFREQGKLDEAVASYLRALQLKPDYSLALCNLGNAFKDQGRLTEAVTAFRQALEFDPACVDAHSSLVYALHFCPGYDAKSIYEEHRRWNQQFAEPLGEVIRSHSNDRSISRRLRIGYVSPDFRNHCQALFTAPLLSSHDHQAFEIFCYADVARPDSLTARLRSCADTWRDIIGLSDEQVAQLIRQDQIDVLVDLTMHMAHGRPLVFARKPAPVQVCWLAYPGTTGLAAIDYRLTDPHLDPPGLFDCFYAEESVRLPDTFWCYDSLTSQSQINPLPVLDRGYVTFGCLNNVCKINDSVLNLWARVLKAVDQSQLLLLSPEGSHREHTLGFMEQEGIARDRTAFVAFRPRPQYLKLYHGIDIGLDTLPYNGHTTSLDSFWMGVPVITLVGQTVVGRAGVSQLMNLGVPDLIAETPDQFVRIAVKLAGDLPRLSKLRATLRERMCHSPLMDASRFARNMESAYRWMWKRWCG